MPIVDYSNYHHTCKDHISIQIYFDFDFISSFPIINSYAITNSAYQWLQNHNEDQCIILSGENGSGKTETSRMIVHFLTQVSDIRNNKTITRQKCSKTSGTTSQSNSCQTTPKHNNNSMIGIPSTSSSSITGCLVKTLNDSIIGGCLKKCSHEKTVDFDFSPHHHHNQSTTTTTVTPSTTIKCQKHTNLQSTQSKICPKHNHGSTTSLLKCTNKTSLNKLTRQSSNSSNSNSIERIPIKLTKVMKCDATTMTMSNNSLNFDEHKIRERLSQADIVLEAFGNATTLKNSNSSRFGKFYDIEFDYKGDPIGGHLMHCKYS